MFGNVNLVSFLTGVTSGSNAGTGFFPSQDGASRITLPELIGFGPDGWDAKYIGGSFGPDGSLTNSVMNNFKKNAAASITTAIVTPIAFRYGKKLFRKPLSTVRRGLKGTGVTV